jgi:hypothetical protein
MVRWIGSLNGAVVTSTVAMVSFIGYALLVFRYVLDELMPGIPGAVIQTLFVLLLIGGWIWSLSSAASGSKAGLIGALICTSLPALFTLYDLVFQSPIPFGWPLVQIAVWVTLISCLAAIAALAYQLSIIRTAV